MQQLVQRQKIEHTTHRNIDAVEYERSVTNMQSLLFDLYTSLWQSITFSDMDF